MLGIDIDFGRCQVIKRPRFGDRCFISHFTRGLCWDWITWDQAGPLAGKWRTISWEGRGVRCGKLAPPRLQPMPVSVKDWWVAPRQQVLNVPIAYRSYGPGKPSSLLLTEAWLKPTTSWLRVGEKLDGVPKIGQPVCRGYSQEFLFLESTGIYPNLLVTRERLLCIDRMRYVWSRTIRGLSVGCVWCVGQVSPTRCTSI
jgi:hypothetical protein